MPGIVKKFDVGALVLDLDGTLVNSKDDIADSLNWTFERLGYEPLPMKVIEGFVGNGIMPLVKNAVVAAGHPERFNDVLGAFRERYYDHLVDKTRLFEGVMDTLETLAPNYKMGIVSNKPHAMTIKITRELGIHRFFNGQIYGGDSLVVRKPDPSAILMIAARYNVPSSRTLVVGDSSVDIMAGKNAGARTVGVTYGFRSVEELTQARSDALIDGFGDLLSFLS
jgi:phosphoglycolate phosphatase